MNKTISTICAAVALAVTFTAVPASAASINYGAQLQNAQFSFGFSTGNQQRGDDRFERRGNSYFYNGQRGYRDRRDGYRQYNGYWFPNSAFSLSFSVDGDRRGRMRDRDRGTQRLSQRHVDWCQDRYRSYDVSSNTFQPFSGGRQECVSPYSS